MALSVLLRPLKAIDYGYFVTLVLVRKVANNNCCLVLYASGVGWFAVVVKDQLLNVLHYISAVSRNHREALTIIKNRKENGRSLLVLCRCTKVRMLTYCFILRDNK